MGNKTGGLNMFVTQTDGEVLYVTSPLKIGDIVYPASPKFPHLCQLKEWVADCEETHEPHKRWEFRFNSDTEWLQCSDTTAMFIKGWQYRKKACKAYINGTEVTLGIASIDEVRAKLKPDTNLQLYVADISRDRLYVDVTPYTLFNLSWLEHLLKHRLVYFNKEDAIARARAMVSWTNNK
jgi:hypothetical protein